jgi:hypothetical protein
MINLIHGCWKKFGGFVLWTIYFTCSNILILRGPNLSLLPIGVAYICPCLVDDKCSLWGIQQACKQVYDFTGVGVNETSRASTHQFEWTCHPNCVMRLGPPLPRTLWYPTKGTWCGVTTWSY